MPTKIIAHRGASGYYTDNSYDAIYSAIDMKSDIIEIDIRLTKDDILILNHDESVIIDKEYIIQKTLYKELNGSLVNLNNLLDTIDLFVIFYLDVKCDNTNYQLYTTKIKEILNRYPNRFFYVASFCKEFIKEFYCDKNNYKLGQIYDNIDFNNLKGISFKIDFIVIDINKTNANELQRIHGLEKFVYTINNSLLVKGLIPYIDGVITDFPDLFSI